MYFLDNNSGVNAMPPIAPVNSTAVRWFTEGSGSLPPSWPGMDWFNIIQAELIGILTAAGMSPDKVRVDQLATAIKSIIGSDALLKKNYLSEIKEAGATAQSAARGNLGLGTAATKNVGTAAGNVMEMGTAGLGVGPIAKTDAYSNIAQFYRVDDKAANKPPIQYTSAGVVSLPIDGAPSTGYLAVSIQGDGWLGRSGASAASVTWTRIFTEKSPPTAINVNAADWRNNFAARLGISRVLSGNNGPTSPGVWSVENSSWAGTTWGSLICTTNSSDLSTTPGNQKFLHYLQITHEAGGKPGLRAAINVNGAFSGWDRVMMTSGSTMSGPLTAPYVASTPNVMPEGSGAFSGQLDSKAPFYQPNWQWSVTAGGLYVPIVKGVSTRQGQGYPSAISFGYLLNGTPGFAHPCIHVRGDNNADTVWRFDPNSKQLFAPGAFVAGSAVYQNDGNIKGDVWGGYISTWMNNQINGRVDWGTYNRDVGARATYDYVNQNFVRDIRLASRGEITTDGWMNEAPGGGVITGGNGNEGSQVGLMYFRYLQKNVNGNWYTVAYA